MALSEIRQVIKSIGDFYLQKNNGDVKKANEEIDNLRFTKIEFLKLPLEPFESVGRTNEDHVVITTMQPGFLIGKRGENVNLLEKHIGKKIHIEEELDLGLLYHYEESESDLLDFDWDEPKLQDEADTEFLNQLNEEQQAMDEYWSQFDLDEVLCPGNKQGIPWYSN